MERPMRKGFDSVKMMVKRRVIQMRLETEKEKN
jgi:hypothetical protein